MKRFSILHRLFPLLLLLGVALACDVQQQSTFGVVGIGAMGNSSSFQPVPQGASKFVLRTAGKDLLMGSADDELVLVGPSGGVQRRIRVPYLSGGEASRPEPLSSSVLALGVATSQFQTQAISVGLVADNAAYWVSINGTRFLFRSMTGVTAADITLALSTAISGGTQPVTVVDLVGTLLLASNQAGLPFDVTVSSNLDLPQTDVVSVGLTVDSSSYGLTINNKPFSYVSGVGAMAADISLQLTTAVNNGLVPVTAYDMVGSLVLIADQADAPFTTVLTSERLSLLSSRSGADFGDYDDALAIVSGLDTQTPTVEIVRVDGPLSVLATSRPVTVDQTRLLVVTGSNTACSATPDVAFNSGDEAVLVVSGIPGTPTVEPPLCVGLLSEDAVTRPTVIITPGEQVALLATTVIPGNSADPFGNASDRLVLIRALSTAPVIVVPYVDAGPLHASEASRPVLLSDTPDIRVLVSTGGTNGVFGDADDTLTLLYNLGPAPASCRLSAPGHGSGALGQAVRVSNGIAVQAAAGTNGFFGDADDRVQLFTGLDVGTPSSGGVGEPCDGGPARSVLPVPYLLSGSSSQPLAISPTQALVATAGADGVPSTNDDGFVLLDLLDTPPGDASVFLDFNTPLSRTGAKPVLFPTSMTKILVRGNLGPGAIPTLFSITGPLAGRSVRSHLNEALRNASPPPLPAGPGTVMNLYPGRDGAWGTADDGLLIVGL